MKSQQAILVYDTTSRKSFEALEKWVEELMMFYTNEVTIFLVANKIDLSPRVISTKEGMNYAQKMDFMYFETSAQTGEGVQEMFNALFSQVLANMDAEVAQTVVHNLIAFKGWTTASVIDAGRNIIEAVRPQRRCLLKAIRAADELAMDRFVLAIVSDDQDVVYYELSEFNFGT
ncbi:hypothetical protein HDU82_000174, partial [Entophlyctis luteolus]